MHRRFEFIHGIFAPHERNPRVDILVDVKRVPQLVGNQFRVVVNLVHQRSVGSSHNMKIYPTQADGIEGRGYMTP